MRSRSSGATPTRVTPDLADFIAQLDTAFLATVSGENGAPYIQHRGGPKGFIKVIDDKTLGFADYRGNRQYITIGNLVGNDHASCSCLTMPTASGSRCGVARGSSSTTTR